MLIPFLAMVLLNTACSTGIRSVKKYTQPPNTLSLDKHETTYIWDISDKYNCNSAAMTFKDTVVCCLNFTVQEIQNTRCEESENFAGNNKLMRASQARINLQYTQQILAQANDTFLTSQEEYQNTMGSNTRTYTRFKAREREKQLEIKKEFNQRNEKAVKSHDKIMSIASDNWDREKIECLQLFQSSITHVQYNQQVLQTLKLNILELSKCKKFAGLLKEAQKSQTYRKTISQSWTNKSFDERVKAIEEENATSETETSTSTKLLKEESDADKAEAEALASVEREARNAAAGAAKKPATMVNVPSKVVDVLKEVVNASNNVVQTDTQVVNANKRPVAAAQANSNVVNVNSNVVNANSNANDEEIRPPSNVVHTPSNVVHTPSNVVHTPSNVEHTDSKVEHEQQDGGENESGHTTSTDVTIPTTPTTPTTPTAPTAPTTSTAPPIPPILFVLSLVLIVLCSQCKFKYPKEFVVPGVTLVCIVLLQVLILHGISTFVHKRSLTAPLIRHGITAELWEATDGTVQTNITVVDPKHFKQITKNMESPTESRVDPNIDFSSLTLKHNRFIHHYNKFIARWSGQLRIDNAGSYEFTVQSNDPSILSIGNKEIVWNSGTNTKLLNSNRNDSTLGHETITKKGVVVLRSGTHGIATSIVHGLTPAPSLVYPASLKITYKGPDTGGAEQIIPKSVLSPTKSVVSFLELDAQQITEVKEHKEQTTLATCKFVQNQVASLIDLPAKNNPIETKSVLEVSYAIHHQYNNFLYQIQEEELTAHIVYNECKQKVDNVFVQAQELAQKALDKQMNVAFDRMKMKKKSLEKVEKDVAQLAKSAETNALEMFTTKKDSVTELLNGMKRKNMQQESQPMDVVLCTRRKRGLQEEKEKIELILEKMNANGKLILPKYT